MHTFWLNSNIVYIDSFSFSYINTPKEYSQMKCFIFFCNVKIISWCLGMYSFVLCCCCVSPSSPSPVTQQMTSMSISQDSGALDSDRVETEEGEEESASTSTGKCHRKHQSVPYKVNQLTFVESSSYSILRIMVGYTYSFPICKKWILTFVLIKCRGCFIFSLCL